MEPCCMWMWMGSWFISVVYVLYYVVSDLERLSLVPPAHTATSAEPNPTAENNEGMERCRLHLGLLYHLMSSGEPSY